MVDDDRDLLVLLRHVLKGRGYAVVTLEQGSEVFATIDAANFDLLILDINIGDCDGREICRKIKNNHSYDHIPVVLFSALVNEKDAMKGCEADGYIEIPISTPLFLQKIETLIAA